LRSTAVCFWGGGDISDYIWTIPNYTSPWPTHTRA